MLPIRPKGFALIIRTSLPRLPQSLRATLACYLLLSLLSISPPIQGATLISLESAEGQSLLIRSQENSAFWRLLRFFETQQTLAFCGVASSVAVLNAMAIPAPFAPGMGGKRLFTQSNFFSPEVAAIRSEDHVKRFGYPLQQLAAALRQWSVAVRVEHVTPELELSIVRADLRRALADPNAGIIVNYQRRALEQAGGGHLSPLAAYEANSDRFLILDVNRLNYAPTWVTAKDLYLAMQTLDNETSTYRGYLVVTNPVSRQD